MARTKDGGSGDFRVSITEVTFSAGPQHHIRVEIEGEDVRIPVSGEVFAYWQEQFVRPNPPPQQRKRFSTLMNVVRAAYKEGLKRSGSG
jgi:hypothetical protein